MVEHTMSKTDLGRSVYNWIALVLFSFAIAIESGCPLIIGCAASSGAQQAAVASQQQVDIAPPASQPSVIDTAQQSGVINALVDAAVQAQLESTVQARVDAALVQFHTTYQYDVWLARIAVVLVFIGYIYTRWESKRQARHYHDKRMALGPQHADHAA